MHITYDSKQDPWGKVSTASAEQMEQGSRRVQTVINFFFFGMNTPKLGHALRIQAQQHSEHP